MIHVGQGGINPNQIQLRMLFSVERVIASRGFTVKKEGDGTDTLLPKTLWEAKEAQLVFEIFNDKKSRRELLEYVLDRNSNPSEQLKSLIDNPAFIKNRNRFSSTFEWYLGELLIKSFGAFSSSYGVTVKDVRRNSDDGDAGDFDVLSILGDTNLLYIETKSGALKSSGITKAIERSLSLHCIATVIVVEKLNDEFIKKLLTGLQYPFSTEGGYYNLTIKGKSDSAIFKWGNCYFVNASKNIEGQLQTVLRLIEYSRIINTQMISPCEDDYKNMGYEIEAYSTSGVPTE